MRILLAFLLCFLSNLLSASPLNSIVVFGDSITDNGNLYEFMNHKIPLSPPYYRGRFSNGPVWIEYLIKSYYPVKSNSHLLDYAFGGAAVSDETNDDSLFTLKHEIDSYLLSHEGRADPHSLFMVWIGANNYLVLPEDVDAAAKKITGGISREIERLVESGAKNIMILNLPDLGRSPAAREFGIEEQLSYLVLRHNEELFSVLTNLEKKYPDVKWLHYDAYAMANEILENAVDYGFTNIEETCNIFSLNKLSQKSILNMAAKAKTLTAAQSQCKGYLFFDPIHLTTLAHQIMANSLRHYLDHSGVEFGL